MPGITHWQSPNFFAYFATTGSEPAILAELLIAALNQVGILWRTGPALVELEQQAIGVARRAARPSRRLARADRGHRVDLDPDGACRWPVRASPDRRVVVCSEQAHSSVDKAARMLELEVRKTPVDDEFRLRPDLLDAVRRLRRRGHRRHDLDDLGRSGGRDRRPRRRRLAPRRRRLRRLRLGAPGAPLVAGRRRARRLARRQRPQVAARADGLLVPLDAPARTSSATRSASSRSTCGHPTTSSAPVSSRSRSAAASAR